MQKKVTLSLDSKVYGDFKDYCEKNAIMLSKKVELIMKDILKKKIYLFFFFIVFASFSAYGLTYSQTSQADFNNGTYNGTVHNSTGVILLNGNINGNYTSPIIDAGQVASWQNVTLNFIRGNRTYFFAVDASAAVYVSKNLSLNYTTQTADYGDGGSSVVEMYSDSRYLYIVFSSTNKRLYRSSNLGVNWTLINDSFTGPSLQLGKADAIGNSYILRGNGVVFKSSDFGVTWNQVGDINPDTATPRGFAINASNALFAVDGDAEVWMSTNQGVSWTQQNASYGGGGSGTDDMAADASGNLYILFNSAIHKSTNQGVSWIVVNSSFTPYATDGAKIISVGDTLYVADLIGRTFRSINGGTSWTELGDINPGSSSNIKGFTALGVLSNFTYQVRSCTLSNCSDGVFVGPSNSPDNFYNGSFANFSLVSRYFQYKAYFTTSDEGITSLLNQASVMYSMIASAPVVSITSPGNGQVFGTNQSLLLNFTVTNSTSPIGACWYTLNNGTVNSSLPGCLPTTFNVSSSGNYTVIVYANETGLGLVGSEAVGFGVQIGAPSVQLIAPLGYLNYTNNIVLSYLAQDIDLASCTLWGDFSGTFLPISTNNTVVSGATGYFYVNLTEGNYQWQVKCNDSASNTGSSGIGALYVDASSPSIVIDSPVGTYFTLTGLPISLSVTDSSPTSCSYNVTFAVSGLVVISNTNLLNCSGSSFNVDSYSSYRIAFRSNDSAGNIAYQFSNFTVSLPSDSGGGNQGGGGGGGGPSVPAQAAKLAFEDLEKLELRRGESRILKIPVKNVGSRYVNNCGVKLDKFGDSQVLKQGIAPGQVAYYDMLVSIPRDIESGLHKAQLTVDCDETSLATSLEVEVPNSNFDFFVIDAHRENTRLFVTYSVKNFLREEQSIDFVYRLSNARDIVVYEGKESIVLGSLAEEVKSFSFELPKDSIGEFSLSFEVSNEEEIVQTEKDVILPRIGLSGFAVSESNRRTIGAAGAVIAVAVVIFFAARLIYMRFRHGPPKHRHRDIISKRKARRPFREKHKRD